MSALASHAHVARITKARALIAPLALSPATRGTRHMAKEDLFQKYAECNIEVPASIIDLTGQRFHALDVVKFIGMGNRHRAMWLCRCDCGNHRTAASGDLRAGHTKTCGVRKNHDLPPEARFWLLVDKRSEDECWPWLGTVCRKGYGRLSVSAGREKKSALSHKFSYEIHKGHIPDKMVVMHTCDNPPCVNPKHLVIGTEQDNIDDRVVKLRSSRVLSPDEVLTIRARYSSGETQKSLGTIYGVSKGAIQSIVTGKNWRWLK